MVVFQNYIYLQSNCVCMTKSREQKFEAIFKAKYKLLLSRAYDFVKDEEVARDIVSDVFTNLWERFDSIDEELAVSYLYKSVINRCLTHIRHERVEQLYLEENPAKELDDEKYSEYLEELLDYLDTVLSKLPDNKRLVFEQCYFEQRKYKEVADLLDMNISTVHKYMVNVFAFLKQEFEKKYKKP